MSYKSMVLGNACASDHCYATSLQPSFAAVISLDTFQCISRITHVCIVGPLVNDLVSNVDPHILPRSKMLL